jgi:hypothetical protein
MRFEDNRVLQEFQFDSELMDRIAARPFERRTRQEVLCRLASPPRW